jgi:hypothetical protein
VVVHCYEVTAAAGGPLHRAGLRFVDDATAVPGGDVSGLIERLDREAGG